MLKIIRLRRRVAVTVVSTTVVAGLFTAPAAGSASDVITVSRSAPAFWEGPVVSVAPEGGFAFFDGWHDELDVRSPAPVLRVSADLEVDGFRDWADGRGPEGNVNWSAFGTRPPFYTGSPGARFWFEVTEPDGTRHRVAMMTGYSTEIFVRGVEVGIHRVSLYPWDLAEYAAAVNRHHEFSRDRMWFRLRAQLGGDEEPAVQGELLPNLRIIPPFELGFAIPTHTFGPGAGTPPGVGHGCMAEEHEEYAFTQTYAAARAASNDPTPKLASPPLHCLRFSAGIENVGDGPLAVSALPWDPSWWELEDGFDLPAYQRVLTRRGQNVGYSDRDLGSAGVMVIHPTHGHNHYEEAYSFVLYRLTSKGRTPVGPSQKRGFNPAEEKLADWRSFQQCPATVRVAPTAPGRCAYGWSDADAFLGVGWGDVYEWNRSGQFAAVDDELGRPRKGEYVLVGVADPSDLIEETDDTDNVSWAHIVITDTDVLLCGRGYGTGPLVAETDGPSCADPSA